MNEPKVMTVDKIYAKYGYKPTTLKYMRQKPKKGKPKRNDGDIPH